MLGSATVSISLPVIGHPSDERLESDIREAVDDVKGVRSVKVDVTELSEEQQVAMMQPLLDAGSAVNGPGSPTRVISVSSGKGGVGKSTVAANVAIALAGFGARVGLLDAEFDASGRIASMRAYWGPENVVRPD